MNTTPATTARTEAARLAALATVNARWANADPRNAAAKVAARKAAKAAAAQKAWMDAFR